MLELNNITNASKRQLGFTLIELMIVVAIISILVAIALPSYQHMVISANESACLNETKAYGNAVFYSLYSNNVADIIPTPQTSACSTITDASSWTTSTASIIYAEPKNSQKQIACDIPQGTPCRIVP